MANEWTKVKLKANWLGHQKGSVLEINSIVADKLFMRKTAVPFKEKKGAKTKDIASPPKDKMMKPVRQKRVQKP